MKNLFVLFFLFLSVSLSAQTDSLPTFNLPPSFTESADGTPRVLSFHDKRDPALAGLLSYFMPGGGQLYNRDYEKAFGIWTVMAFSMVMSYQTEVTGDADFGEAILGMGMSGAWLYSFIDAIVTAKKINKAISLQLSRSTSITLKPNLQLTRNPGMFGLSRPEAVVGLRLKVSL